MLDVVTKNLSCFSIAAFRRRSSVNYKPELRPIIGKARSAFFEGMEPPASTLVGVSALAAPEWLIEIEAIAVAD